MRTLSPSVLVFVAGLGLLAGCGEPGACPAAVPGPVASEPAFALVASDYLSTAVGLLDGRGEVLVEAWVDSGSEAPGLAMALSGDVALPTEPPPPGRLVLLDRYGTDVVDHFDLRSGAVLGQWPTSTERPGEAAWRANPHDALRLPGGSGPARWVVSRFEPNLDPAAPDLDRGDDLLLLDEDGALVGRWDLAAARLPAEGERPPLWARPSRMALRGGGRWLVVGLARLSADFRHAGPGAVAVLDARDGSLVDLCELPGLRNCPEVAVDPSEPLRFFVACRGPAFAPLPARRAEAGVVAVRLDETSGRCAREEARWDGAGAAPGTPVPTGGLVPAGGGALLAVAEGEASGGVPDRLLWLRPGEAPRTVHEAEGAFVLGQGAASPDGSWLLVPSAEQGLLRLRLDAEAEAPHLEATVPVAGCRGLPPRQLARLGSPPGP